MAFDAISDFRHGFTFAYNAEPMRRFSLPRIRVFHWYDGAILVYILFSLFLSSRYDFRIRYGLAFHIVYDSQLLTMTLASILALACFVAVSLRLRMRDSHLFGPGWRRALRTEYFTPQKLFDLARTIILIKLVLVVYTNIKQAIPRINPLVTDQWLLDIDIAIHLGANPVHPLVDLLSDPVCARIIDVSYVLWYPFMPLGFVIFIFVLRHDLTHRFFGAYLLLWMIGGSIALLLPSLGPIYTHPEWFSGLDTPIATKLQQMLWVHYRQLLDNPEQYRFHVYSGIAAFPSLHVGIVALFAFFTFRVHRLLGIILVLYAAVVQIGSVFLGWHYAVDGYFAILLAYLFYRLSLRSGALLSLPERCR